MPPDNVAVAKRSIDLFNTGGLDAALICFTADVIVHPFAEWIEEPTYRGHEGLRAMMSVWTESFEDFQIVASELREAGENVVMLGEITGRVKGVLIRQPTGVAYFNFRNNQIGEFRNYLSWQQALEAVGLGDEQGVQGPKRRRRSKADHVGGG
jgi:hypothetical protein